MSFREVDQNFKKLGHSNNTWSDYLILRSIGVATRAKPPPTMIEYTNPTGFTFEAELLAVIHAISIAHNRGWFSLWVEADSEYVVRLLQARSMDVPWRFIGLWKQTIVKLSDFNMQVSHIYREGNRAADIMANQDRNEGWWPFAIEEIKLATNLDMATHSAIRIKN
ncbi:uncharacterized protein LOC130990654 [Salvia miltiorrhiza]|uniref:uncharacterized protein LOC130990654 n=1 Tax=Salvia miltiorrhiza TaxID=226208 RepID=UPI0025ABED57|nr:uncharacterized protein LOC130990654 [Salvia miltiorrhiza]